VIGQLSDFGVRLRASDQQAAGIEAVVGNPMIRQAWLTLPGASPTPEPESAFPFVKKAVYD
jgi:hypothetical protein